MRSERARTIYLPHFTDSKEHTRRHTKMHFKMMYITQSETEETECAGARSVWAKVGGTIGHVRFRT